MNTFLRSCGVIGVGWPVHDIRILAIAGFFWLLSQMKVRRRQPFAVCNPLSESGGTFH